MPDEILFTKISALLIRNNKLLIVRGANDDFYKNLGGKVEGGETDEECLRREIMEEAQVEMTNFKFYFELKKQPLPNQPGKFLDLRFYIVEVEGEPTINPNDQTQEFYWISKKDFETKDIKMVSGLKNHAIPKLIQDVLLT